MWAAGEWGRRGLGTHAAPRVWQGEELRCGDPLRLLRTDAPADELRRNIRLVGQVLRGHHDWRWLRPATGRVP